MIRLAILNLAFLLFGNTLFADLKKPNILWIIAEDMGPDIGCYGTAEAHTPHMDGLAAQGVRYANAFTVTPVCSTSRSSFMTGMYAMTIGAHNHRSHRGDGFQLSDGVKVLTDWLRPVGYFTANVVHLTDGPNERFFRGTGKNDWNFDYQGKPFDSNRWSDLKAHQPFFAQVNFPETHRGGEWDNAHKAIEKTADPAKVQIPPYYPDHPLVRQVWAQYLNTIMAFDKKVGFVLQKLKEDGLADDTVVMVFGDHGRAMVRGKQWPYDSGLHVPLIIRWPPNFPTPSNLPEPGSVDEQLIASIDWSATTLALAGVEKPTKMQGKVFLGENADPPRRYLFAGRDRGDETVFRIRTVRDVRYRYLRNFMPERPFLQINRYKEHQYPELRLIRKLAAEGKLNAVQAVLAAPRRPAEELYDVQSDPHETKNLVESADHHEPLERMRAALDQWIESSDDQGRFPEPAAIVNEWEARMKKTYDARLKKQAVYEKKNGIRQTTRY